MVAYLSRELLSGKRKVRGEVRGFRPGLEGLEGRVTPAITSITQNLAAHVATITANNAADTITLTDRGVGGVSVTGSGLSTATRLDASIRTIKVNSKGGNDQVTYNLTGNLTRSMKVVTDLALGNDSFAANLSGHSIGNNSTLNLITIGGGGSDSLRVNAGTAALPTNVAAGSTLRLEMQAGSDFDLFDGNDTVNVTYRGRLDGKLILKADGGLGDDVLTALATLDAGSHGFVKGDGTDVARVAGGFGADRLDFRVRDNSGGTAHVAAEANAGLDLSADVVFHTSNVSAFLILFGDQAFVVN